MEVLIIEDEELASLKLQKTLQSVSPEAQIVGITESIESSARWLKENPAPDLILMDIELTDGQSFEIFNQVQVSSAVIFTTSYDEHALRAFKVNSIDYLLKPVQKDELLAAMEKYKRFNAGKSISEQASDLDRLLESLQGMGQKSYRKRFLVKSLQRLVSINTTEIAYFYSEDRLNFFKTHDDKRFIVDYTLDDLESMLDPEQFFRIGRALLVSVPSIAQIHDYFGHRLSLKLMPPTDKESLVSREKVSGFKSWLGR